MKKSLYTKFWNNVSLAVELFGPAYDVRYLDNLGPTVDTTGVSAGNTGTFYYEGTDENPFYMNGTQNPNITSWEPVDVTPVNTLAGTDVKFRPDLNQFPFAYFRVHFVPAGTPSGTVVGYMQGKGI
jgi:hypothetical protein